MTNEQFQAKINAIAEEGHYRAEFPTGHYNNNCKLYIGDKSKPDCYLHVSNGKYSSGGESRLGFSGNSPLPDGSVIYWIKGGRITVSADRPALAIVNDIEKRLIPSYILAYEKALEVIQGQKSRMSTKQATVEALKKIIPNAKEISHSRDYTKIYSYHPDIDVEVSESDPTKIYKVEFGSMPLDTFKAIMEALKTKLNQQGDF